MYSEIEQNDTDSTYPYTMNNTANNIRSHFFFLIDNF